MSCSLKGAPDASRAPTWLIHVVEAQHMVFYGVHRIVKTFLFHFSVHCRRKSSSKSMVALIRFNRDVTYLRRSLLLEKKPITKLSQT